MEQTESQWKEIYKYLQSGRSLTMYDMLVKFGVGNHTGRIADIRRHHGYNSVKTEMITLSNGKRVARYSINSD